MKTSKNAKKSQSNMVNLTVALGDRGIIRVMTLAKEAVSIRLMELAAEYGYATIESVARA